MKLPKWLIISALIIGVGAGGGGGYFLWQRSQASAEPEITTQPTPLAPELSTWNDPVGFTFQYPKDISVDPNEDDNTNYAHVELTHKDHPGKLIVWVKDTTAADAAAWVKTEKQFKAANVMDTTVGGQPGKKVLIADPALLVSGMVADELLFMIETTPTDAAYWNEVHETVSSTFAFTPVAGGEKQAAGASGGDTSGYEEAVDEEETIE